MISNRTHRGHFRAPIAIVGALLALSVPHVSAQSNFWFRGGTNGSLGTTGNWAIDASGTTNGTTPGVLDIVTFSVTASNSVPLNRWSMGSANRSYGSIIVSNSGTNFIMRTSDSGATNSTSFNLTLLNGITNASGAGAFQLGDTDRKATLKLGNTDANFSVANNSASSMTFQQQVGLSSATASNRTLVVSGTGTGNTVFQQGLENGGNGTSVLSLSINNTGAVWIDGPSTYTGGTTLTSGTIALGSSSALGTGLLTINGGAIGSVNSARTLTNNVVVGGNFGFGVTNAGFNGQTTTLNGNVDLGASTRTITMLANSANIGGVISGAGGLIVESSSATRALNLTNANTYTGATVINGGIFRVNGSLASSSVTVNTGATLGGSGTISGDTTISSGAFLAPGNSPGLLTFGNNLTLAGEVVMELNGTTTRGTDYDAVNVGNLLTYGGKLTLSLTGTYTAGATFNLFDFASTGGSFTSIDLNGSYTGSLVNNLGTWTGTVGGVDWQFTQNDGIFQAVPEPSTYALIGMTAVAFAGYSIRRRKRSRS